MQRHDAGVGPAADSASRGPSSRTSVSTSPRRAGPGQRRTDDGIDMRLGRRRESLWPALFEPHIVGGQRAPGGRSRAATTTSAWSPSGSDRNAATAAKHDERGGGDPTGGDGARPVRSQALAKADSAQTD